MTRILLWLLIIIAVVVQTTIVPFLQVGNARPDILLILSVSMGLIYGRPAGASIGFFSGLLWDLLTAQIFGMYTLAKLISGYTAGAFEKKIFKEHPILPIIALFLATFIHEMVLYLSAAFLGISAPFGAMLGQTMLPNALYNGIIAPFIYFGVYRIRELIWVEDHQDMEY